jgi:hypothetical protein
MKTHFVLGFLIGAAINFLFQHTDTTSRLDVLELAACASVAALAALTAAFLQGTTSSRPHQGFKSLLSPVKFVSPRPNTKPHN